MKFNFKIQQYQTDAVNSVVDAFVGQPFQDKVSYIRDLGKANNAQPNFYTLPPAEQDIHLGFENAEISKDIDILKNIREIQAKNNIKLSDNLIGELGKCSLDIEMETGTGKTYVYIKTMFELNKKYGWSKFIVVVPSIAIREGVYKSFKITQDHFMEYYGKKARFFIYNSKNLNDIDSFSSSYGINVMIINMQAFNARGKDARRIYDELDSFNSRKPIDVIAKNRPILIMDEPQKMGGKATQKGLQNFNPLFCLNYSATHAKHHNLVYVLDALDAYNKRLVKKIEVKGFEIKNLRGTNKYLYLEDIIVSPKNPPKAKIELEINCKNYIKRDIRILGVEDDLYDKSKKMEQYKDGYIIKEIDPLSSTVTFTNGLSISCGEAVGNVSEKDIRRIQIRETISSHFQKEEKLFDMGIKTLSLFFIDEVSKYRVYSEDGEEVNSEYGDIFEQEYTNKLNEYMKKHSETPYVKYLKSIDVKDTHKGYFSIDKKGHITNSKIKRGIDESDDISAYDLILKNKERLISFEEPTRFIFSHSALREGWDNPNIFQICTLKHSDSSTTKRQEVGRGLRLCVNSNGDRMDAETCGDDVQDINKLTVIASESYYTFVSDLQKQTKEVLYDRPTKATIEYFEGKNILVNEKPFSIDKRTAKIIYRYLSDNKYIDYDDKVTDTYKSDHNNNCLAPLPKEISQLTLGVHDLVQSIFDESVLKNMFNNGKATPVENKLNDNFNKKEFQTLWNYINHKYAYTVEFDSSELIKKSINHINQNLYVSQLQYKSTISEQKKDLDVYSIEHGDSFNKEKTKTKTLSYNETSQIRYDLIGKIAQGTTLTRKTITAILKGISSDKFAMFKDNPEEFINHVIKLINEQKASMIVDHITYNQIDGKYESKIFTMSKRREEYSKAYQAKKSIQDYVFTDGIAEKSTERTFAEALDSAAEVCVYAKLPKGFSIPTPVGNYSPDWAIAFYEGTVKHIYFIAETKGTMDSMQFKNIESVKIDCAKHLFNELPTSKVKYHNVNSYQDLLNIMNSL